MRLTMKSIALSMTTVLTLLFLPHAAAAQKALVYCPIGIDVSGCATIKSALTADFPGGVDTGFDGTGGTVDLSSADLFQYSVVVVPSLAETDSTAPYAELRKAAVVARLKAAVLGRRAFWSGTPDQGVLASTRPQKDALIRNLAAWASADFAKVNAPGLVVLQDNSDDVTSRYSWVQPITGVNIIADPKLASYASVQSLTSAGNAVLSSDGATLAYANMASYGFQTPAGGAGLSLDAVGQTGTGVGGQVVLITQAGGNTGGAVVQTDKDDYAPGTTVVITGTGFGANETVSILLHEDPTLEPDITRTATTDANGSFEYTGFAPDQEDVDLRFILTVKGMTSGKQAQTTFTDGATDYGISITPATVATGGVQSYTIRLWNSSTSGSNNIGSANITVPAGWTVTTPLATPTGAPNTRTWTSALSAGVIQLRSTANSQNLARTTGSNAADTIKLVLTATAPSVLVNTPFTWNAQVKPTITFTGADFTLVGSAATVTVNAPTNVNTTTTVSSAANPSVFGAAVTFTATVAPATGSVVPTGGVSFSIDGGAAQAGTAGAPSGSSATFTLAAPANLSAGTHTVVATYAPTGVFVASSNSATPLSQVVNAAAQPTVTLTLPATATYPTGFNAVAAGGASGATYTYSTTSTACSVNGSTGAVNVNSVGACLITVVASAANYLNATDSKSVNIDKATQTITFAALAARAYGDADFTVSATASSGQPVTFAVGATDKCTIAGATVHLTGSGSCTVTASQAGDGNYLAATPVSQTFTISARALTVTADAQAKGYGDVDPTLTYKVTVGSLVAGDAITGTLTRVAGENVGVFAIQQGTLSAGANYTLTFVGANLTIGPRAVTVSADAVAKGYGDADPALTYKITSGALVAGDAFTGALARAAGEAVASYAINQGTLSLGTNYTLSFVGANLTVTARPITVTATAASKIYGAADPAFAYSVTNGSLVSGDAFAGALSRASGEAVGTYAISQGTLALNANYALTFASANLTITAKPITVTADAKSKQYGAADPALTYSVTAGGPLVGGDAITGALSRAPGENAGAYGILQGTLTAGTNYTITFVGADLTIQQRPIAITADAKTKVYGDADPALTYQITSGSLASGDAFSGALSRAAGAGVGTYAIQQGTLTAGPNYVVAFTGANLTVTARPIAVKADAQTKVYGDADPAFTYQVTSGALIAGDAFSGTLARAPGSGVGSYAINAGSLAGGPNYDLTFTSANLVVTPRPIAITADAQSKTYGEPDPVLTFKITSGALVPGDAIGGSQTRASGENVGSYAIGQGTLSAGANYSVTYAGSSLNITTRAVTATAEGKTKVYGDPDPALTVKVTSGSLAFSDAFSGTLTRASGENVGTYAIQQGTLALNANYVLTFVGANLGVTPRPITLTADAKTKAYGDAEPALTYQVTSGSFAYSDACVGLLARAPGENVGSYAITQGGLTLSTNYTLTFIGANLTITPRLVTATADAKTKVYGDADPALSYQLTSGTLVNGDAFSGSLARTAGDNVGAYPITQGTLALSANYTLSYVGANLSVTQRPVTATADSKTKVYGEADPALTYAISSGNLIGADAFSGALARAAGENVGSYAIGQGTLALSGNYALTFVSKDLTIGTRPIAVTADAKSKIYGDADPALTYKLTAGSLVGSDAFSGGLARNAGNGVGTYAITQGSLSAGANYALSFVSANLSITPRPVTVTADGKTKVYGEADPALTHQVTSGSLVYGDTFTGSLSRAAGNTVGAYGITQGTLSLGANYTLGFVGANLVITPRPVTITPVAPDLVWTGFTLSPSYSLSVTGGSLASADGVSTLGSPVYAPSPSPVKNVGVYSLIVSGLANANYTIATTAGSFTVLDQTKPTGAITELNPVPTGTAPTLKVNFTDVATGNSNIVAWRYRLDAGAYGASIPVVPGAPSVNLVATLPSSSGTDVINVCTQGQDAGLNWSAETCGLLAIYDPTAGFVTGGGWIMSPTGAYLANPSLTGKANFGFVSKYLKGANVPSGNTEFQFQEGNLNFKSTTFQWLVISGTSQAQFKGTGTINGGGSYNFLVTAIDGDAFTGAKKPDSFRIKITDASTGAVVYDNQLGADDTSASATVIGGGSIQIQAK